MKKNNKNIYILLSDIRSVHNVGSIFRTAESVGVKKVFLSGFTPTPIDRFGNFRKDFAKTSLGSEKTVDWKHYKSPISVIKKLKKENVSIVSVEQDEKSIDYRKINLKFPLLLVFGSETEGVSKKVLDLSDEICELPMLGKKESLNVSVCAGIILYDFTFRN